MRLSASPEIPCNAYPLSLYLLPMNKKVKQLETETRASVAELRAIPGMEKLADSFTRLMDGASKGGKARAKKLTKKRRKEIATAAANKQWNNG